MTIFERQSVDNSIMVALSMRRSWELFWSVTHGLWSKTQIVPHERHKKVEISVTMDLSGSHLDLSAPESKICEELPGLCPGVKNISIQPFAEMSNTNL